MDFPLEIMANIFSELPAEDAWSARRVCRYWHSAFELVSYSSSASPLNNIRIGVEAICGLTSSTTGEIIDHHVVRGDLHLQRHRPMEGNAAKWGCDKRTYEYWPGGKWRKYELGHVLTDVRLHIAGLPSQKSTVSLRLGSEVSLCGEVVGLDRAQETGENHIQQFVKLGNGEFSDVTLLIEKVEEPFYHGRVCVKHCITGFLAPKWQIYALLVHHVKKQRELEERLRKQYVKSYYNRYSLVLPKIRRVEHHVKHAASLWTAPIAAGWQGWPRCISYEVEVEC